MKKICYILIPTLLILPIIASGSQTKDLEFEFNQDDTYYSFRASFHVKTEPDYLINLLYDFNNLSEYSFDAKSVELIQEGDNWYDTSYTYRKFLVLQNTSTWRRTLRLDEHKIVFELLSSKNNLKIMPEMLSSTGYYQIFQETDHCRVEYYQECLLKPGFLKDAYINMAKQEAIEFVHKFKKYLERKCE